MAVAQLPRVSPDETPCCWVYPRHGRETEWRSYMTKIGASSYIWVSPFSTDRLDQLSHAKSIGFDVYEIAVENPDVIDIERVREEARRVGIDVNICGAFGENRDISRDVDEYSEKGIA